MKVLNSLIVAKLASANLQIALYPSEQAVGTYTPLYEVKIKAKLLVNFDII